MNLIPMLSALLAFRLRSSLGCQKQAGCGDCRTSPETMKFFPFGHASEKVMQRART